MLLHDDDDDHSEGYGQIKETFIALTKNDILKPYISDHYFRSTNANDAREDDDSVGYKLYVLDMRYQNNFLRICSTN